MKLPTGTTSNPIYASSTLQVNYYFPDDLSTPATCSQPPAHHHYQSRYVITALNQTGNVVEVRVNNYPWNWMVPLPNFMPGTGISLSASSLDVMESLPPADDGTYPNAFVAATGATGFCAD